MANDFELFDLAGRISVPFDEVDRGLTATQRKVLDLAKQFEATEQTARKSAVTMATSMAAVNAEIGKMRTSNLAADYDKFANALHNNSTNARKAADDFLALLNPVKGGGKAAAEAAGETRNLSEGLRVLANSAIVAEGPMGGVSSRLRALASETTEVGSLLGPTGIVVLGLAATAAAAAAAGVGIFELAKHAAEYGEEIYKAQASTGLSAQTLSVLKVISGETGTSFDSLTMSASRMQVAINRAFTEKGGEATRALELLKLRTDEFRNSRPDEQFLKIAKALQEQTNQSDKNRAALALVSRGFNVSANALKEFGDHYDEAARKADAFGLMLSQRDVDAAHEFDVALKDLGLGVEGLGIQVGQRTIPAIESAMDDLARALGLNESSWKSWGEYIGNILSGVVIVTASSVAAINQAISNIKTGFSVGTSQIGRLAGDIGNMAIGASTLNPVQGWRGGSNLLKEVFGPSTPDAQAWKNAPTPSQAYETERSRILKEMTDRFDPNAGQNKGGGGVSRFPSGGGAGKKGSNQAAEDFIKGLQLQEKEATRVYGNITHVLDAFYSHHQIGLQQYISQEVAAAQTELNAKLKTIDAEMAATAKLKGPAQDLKRKEILEKRATAEQAFNQKQFDLAVKQSEAMLALSQSYRDMEIKIESEKDARLSALAQDFGQQKILTAETTERITSDLAVQALKRERANLVAQQRDKREDADEYEKIGNQITAVDAQIETARQTGHLRIADARRRDIVDLRQWADETKAIETNLLIGELDTQKRRIDLLQKYGAISTRQATGQLMGVDIQSENAKFAESQSQLQSQIEESKAKMEQFAEAAIVAMASIGEDGADEAIAGFNRMSERYDLLLKQMQDGEKTHTIAIKEIRMRAYDQMNEQLKTIAQGSAQILGTFESDIFTKGWKAAFANVGISFLNMIKDMEMKLIESKLLQMLQGLMIPSPDGDGGQSTGGGGGFFGFLSKWILPLVGAAVGGAIGGGGAGGHGGALSHAGTGGGIGPAPHGFASGTDYVPYDMMAMIHQGERIIPASENRNGAGAVHNHYHQWNITTRDAESFQSRETQRQIGDRLRRTMQKGAMS